MLRRERGKTRRWVKSEVVKTSDTDGVDGVVVQQLAGTSEGTSEKMKLPVCSDKNGGQ